MIETFGALRNATGAAADIHHDEGAITSTKKRE